MKEIKTISDLSDATKEEIEEVRASIDLKQHYYFAASQLGKETGLTMDEYRAFLDEREPVECRSCSGEGQRMPRRRSVGTIHASSAHMCRTRLYYDVTGEHPPKQEISHELQITFAMGHAIHDKIQKALHFAFPGEFQDEIPVDLYEAFVAGSSADGVVDLGHTRVLVEIKSIGKEFDKLKAPKDAHLIQAAGIYATALDTPFISYLYVSKAWPHLIKEFVIPYSEMVYKKWWRAKGSKVEGALEANEPPIADAEKYECVGCPYNYFCTQSLDRSGGRRLR